MAEPRNNVENVYGVRGLDSMGPMGVMGGAALRGGDRRGGVGIDGDDLDFLCAVLGG